MGLKNSFLDQTACPKWLIKSGDISQRVKGWFLWGSTVKPVCNDHLFNKINHLWFIQ